MPRTEDRKATGRSKMTSCLDARAAITPPLEVLPGQRNRMPNPADTVQPGFIEPFANAFWSWKGYLPNETKLSPYGVGYAKGGQWWNLAGEFECASLRSFA